MVSDGKLQLLVRADTNLGKLHTLGFFIFLFFKDSGMVLLTAVKENITPTHLL